MNEYGEVWPINLVWDIYVLVFGIYEEAEEYYKYFPEKSLGAFFTEAIKYEAEQKGGEIAEKAMVFTDFFHR